MFALAVALAASTLFLPSLGFAFDRNYTVGGSFSWSPYAWSKGAYRAYSDNSIMVGYFNFKFNSSAASQHNNGSYYLTIEILNVTDNAPHSGWFATNLPSPGYDTDDDDYDGKDEESEAYALGTISAEYTYYFNSGWSNTLGKNGTFEYVVQRSLWNPFGDGDDGHPGEMEAVHFDLMDRHNW